MSKKTLELNGPYTISVELAMILNDGEQTGTAKYALPVGRFPTKELIDNAIKQVLKQTSEATKSEARMMTKREFWDHICEENFGIRFAMEGGEDWDEATPPTEGEG